MRSLGTFSAMNSSGFKHVDHLLRSSPFPHPESPSNSPFLFHTPSSITPPQNLFWRPPPVPTSPTPEVADVSMDDAAPASPPAQKPKEDSLALVPRRKVSQGAVKRVFRDRHRAHSRSSKRKQAMEQSIEESSTDDEQEHQQAATTEPITSNHHYTFNIPSIPVSRSEVPYMLLGYV